MTKNQKIKDAERGGNPVHEFVKLRNMTYGQRLRQVELEMKVVGRAIEWKDWIIYINAERKSDNHEQRLIKSIDDLINHMESE